MLDKELLFYARELKHDDLRKLIAQAKVLAEFDKDFSPEFKTARTKEEKEFKKHFDEIFSGSDSKKSQKSKKNQKNKK